MKRLRLAKNLPALSCRTCGAKPLAKCKLNSGQPRNEPHVDREESENEMWINPNAIISGWKDGGDYSRHAWNIFSGSREASRYLELAAIAIGRKNLTPGNGCR
jgi:hypothetical protein